MQNTESNLSMSSLPAKPAFLFPHVGRHKELHEKRADDARVTSWLGCYRRRTANILTSRMVKVFDRDLPARQSNGYFEDQVYGNTSGLVLPVLNAALYD